MFRFLNPEKSRLALKELDSGTVRQTIIDHMNTLSEKTIVWTQSQIIKKFLS